VLSNWKQDPHKVLHGNANDGVSFSNVAAGLGSIDEPGSEITLATNASEPKKDYQRRDKSQVTCYRCRKKGHFANECNGERAEGQPNERQTGEQMLMAGIETGEFDNDPGVGFTFHQEESDVPLKVKEGQVPSSWILLDNQSTVDIFHNADLLKNIHTGDGHMYIHCNAGVTSTNLIGDLPGYGQVWYHPNGIANILSLKQVKTREHRVTYDSSKANEFHVHKADGTIHIFKESPCGLYYSDASIRETGTLLVNTVDHNKSKYTKHDYSRAVLAQKTQKMIGRPSTRSFISIVEKNLLPNCPVTRRNIAMTEDIFGPDLGSLKGKTVRSAAAAVNVRLVDIPAHIMTHYTHLTLGGDIMFVNKIPFFMSISRHIRFRTGEMLQNQKSATILAAIEQIKSIYMKRGFKLDHMLMEGQFEPLRAELADLSITLNTVTQSCTESVGD
jgi:hypothetical protein